MRLTPDLFPHPLEKGKPEPESSPVCGGEKRKTNRFVSYFICAYFWGGKCAAFQTPPGSVSRGGGGGNSRGIWSSPK